jgi:hypothetical protein
MAISMPLSAGATQDPLRIAARSFPRALGRAAARSRNYLSDLDRRRALATDGLYWSPIRQAGNAGSSGSPARGIRPGNLGVALQGTSRLKIGFAPVEQIERLEIRIEELREAIERSRRLMLAGQACAVVGPAMFVCFMLGLIDFTPVRMIVGIALAIGGVVLTGSSRASTEQLMLSLKRTEEERSAAIDALELVQLPDRS